MRFYYTDNEISQTVAHAFASNKKHPVVLRHIDKFTEDDHTMHTHDTFKHPYIFYGLLRGCSNAMTLCKHMGIPFLYVDNGYFDAKYVDANMVKDLYGKYRIACNDMVTTYDGNPESITPAHTRQSFLLLPPSPYTANYYNTTPEDWTKKVSSILKALGHNYLVKAKDNRSPFHDYLDLCDAVIAYNSMGVVEAIRKRKPVITEKGIIRNTEFLSEDGIMLPKYDYYKLTEYYAGNQFTLEEIKAGAWTEKICTYL